MVASSAASALQKIQSLLGSQNATGQQLPSTASGVPSNLNFGAGDTFNTSNQGTGMIASQASLSTIAASFPTLPPQVAAANGGGNAFYDANQTIKSCLYNAEVLTQQEAKNGTLSLALGNNATGTSTNPSFLLSQLNTDAQILSSCANSTNGTQVSGLQNQIQMLQQQLMSGGSTGAATASISAAVSSIGAQVSALSSTSGLAGLDATPDQSSGSTSQTA